MSTFHPPAHSRRFVGSVGQIAAIVGPEARKLAHDPSELLLRAVQPALWLVVFGSVFSVIHLIPPGSLSYLVDAPRILKLSGGSGLLPLGADLGVLVLWAPVLIAVGA